MEKYFLAVDIGASSGRHILSHLEDGKIVLEEVFRFENGMQEIDGHKCWDSDLLFSNIKEGMKKCSELGKVPAYMGIDTWGVDYVLVDKAGKRIGNAVGYRDDRTAEIDREVYQIIPEKDLYARTGIAKQVFNTIYQLAALKKESPEQLEQADTLLMSPDYYNFLLTGKRASEYTIASTGQLVNPETKDWDYELIRMLGFPEKIFTPLQKPGTILGNLSKEVQAEIGYDCCVVMVPSHDTASAVLAVPSKTSDFAYISSGTWSLLGVELDHAICNEQSRKANFTNEGGYDYTVRFLKNIMGLWMIQSVRKEFTEEYSYAHICEQASRQLIPSIVDCNDDRFLAPESMTEAVKSFCRESGQQVPANEWETAAVIYNSLGQCYADTIREIEALTGKHYDRIHVVGGGSNAEYLNRITARYTGRTVCAGPGEATAIGNLLVQMISDGVFKNLKEARACVRDSFDIRQYRE